MINVYKQGDKLIGVCKIFVSNAEFNILPNVGKYVGDLVLNEIKSQVDSDLFTYENITTIKENSPDLFGINYNITFEFVPNKEYMDTLKLVSERLEVGL